MITRLKQVVLIGAFLCTTLISNAQQVKQFADDETLYFQQLEQFFSNSAQSQTLNKYLKQFKKTWDSGVIDRDDKSRIVQTSNNLLKKYGKPSPHFYNFLQTVEQFYVTEQTTESFHAWDDAYNYLLKTASLKKPMIFVNNRSSYLQIMSYMAILHCHGLFFVLNHSLLYLKTIKPNW